MFQGVHDLVVGTFRSSPIGGSFSLPAHSAETVIDEHISVQVYTRHIDSVSSPDSQRPCASKRADTYNPDFWVGKVQRYLHVSTGMQEIKLVLQLNSD